jgi:hypothetical protein
MKRKIYDMYQLQHEVQQCFELICKSQNWENVNHRIAQIMPSGISRIAGYVTTSVLRREKFQNC